MAKMERQELVAGGYVTTYTETDEKAVYKLLANELTWRYVERTGEFSSVRRVTNSDGTATITVSWTNGYRDIFTVSER